MNRNRLLIGLSIAVIVGFMLSSFVYRVFKQATAPRPAETTDHIVVAATSLQLGTRLDSGNVKLISWPGSKPMAGMLTRLEDAENRALITPVAENEPILEAKLASTRSGAGGNCASARPVKVVVAPNPAAIDRFPIFQLRIDRAGRIVAVVAAVREEIGRDDASAVRRGHMNRGVGQAAIPRARRCGRCDHYQGRSDDQGGPPLISHDVTSG